MRLRNPTQYPANSNICENVSVVYYELRFRHDFHLNSIYVYWHLLFELKYLEQRSRIIIIIITIELRSAPIVAHGLFTVHFERYVFSNSHIWCMACINLLRHRYNSVFFRTGCSFSSTWIVNTLTDRIHFDIPYTFGKSNEFSLSAAVSTYIYFLFIRAPSIFTIYTVRPPFVLPNASGHNWPLPLDGNKSHPSQDLINRSSDISWC